MPLVTDTLTPQQETTILAALALAAGQYADPSGIYDTISTLCPSVDWSAWIASVEAYRCSSKEGS